MLPQTQCTESVQNNMTYENVDALHNNNTGHWSDTCMLCAKMKWCKSCHKLLRQSVASKFMWTDWTMRWLDLWGGWLCTGRVDLIEGSPIIISCNIMANKLCRCIVEEDCRISLQSSKELWPRIQQWEWIHRLVLPQSHNNRPRYHTSWLSLALPLFGIDEPIEGE